MSGPSLSRRETLKWLAAGLAAQPLLSACATARGAGSRTSRHLGPVHVAPEKVIRRVAGLRPFRPSGFVVRAEPFGDKTLVHNYGHGGGGITLSWGTAQLALELAAATPHRSAAVLGCGAVGLATARLLQNQGFAVTIYAKDLPPNTTSNIAGAQWSPFTVADRDRRTPEFDAQFTRAARFAYLYFQHLAGHRHGVWWRENYSLSENPPTQGRSWENELMGDLIKPMTLTPREHPFGRLHVRRFLAMHIEPSIYLAAVITDFRIAGGTVVVRGFADRNELATLAEPLVVNCTGLGAGALFGDTEILPIKGQLTVLAPQPEVDYITLGPGSLYMMPRQDGIVLGGTHERGEWSLEPNPAEDERIMQGHQRLFDGMR